MYVLYIAYRYIHTYIWYHRYLSCSAHPSSPLSSSPSSPSSPSPPSSLKNCTHHATSAYTPLSCFHLSSSSARQFATAWPARSLSSSAPLLERKKKKRRIQRALLVDVWSLFVRKSSNLWKKKWNITRILARRARHVLCLENQVY